MACRWDLFIVSEEEGYAARAAGAVWAEIDRIEAELSRFVPHSDIARLNDAPVGRAVRLGPDAWECLELAVELCEATGGAFDVTVGACVGKIDVSLPPAPRVELDTRDRTARRCHDTVAVDLGGIGKGYGLDRAAAILREWGLTNALIHCGQSTAAALGKPPNAEGWPLALRDPHDDTRTAARVMLRDMALSGSAARLHGAHIVDPRTGRPARGPEAAWAWSPSAATADALSTACMVMAPEAIRASCRRLERVGAAWFSGERLDVCGCPLRGLDPDG